MKKIWILTIFSIGILCGAAILSHPVAVERQQPQATQAEQQGQTSQAEP